MHLNYLVLLIKVGQLLFFVMEIVNVPMVITCCVIYQDQKPYILYDSNLSTPQNFELLNNIQSVPMLTMSS